MSRARRAKVAGRLSKTGTSLVEALCALCLLVPFLLFALDGCVFVAAMNFNETVCRNACRAASMGAPNVLLKGEPEKNALAIIANANSDAGYMHISPAPLVSENVRKPLPVAPFGGPVDGEVSVVTTCAVTLPFSGSFLRQGAMQLKAKKIFAYSWVLPAQASLVGK